MEFNCDPWVSLSFLQNNNHQAVNKMNIHTYTYIYREREQEKEREREREINKNVIQVEREIYWKESRHSSVSVVMNHHQGYEGLC